MHTSPFPQSGFFWTLLESVNAYLVIFLVGTGINEAYSNLCPIHSGFSGCHLLLHLGHLQSLDPIFVTEVGNILKDI